MATPSDKGPGQGRLTTDAGSAPTMPGSTPASTRPPPGSEPTMPGSAALTPTTPGTEQTVASVESVPQERPRRRKSRAASAFRRGDRIDRFVVLEVLGAGGMAVVFSAYDPGLDRRVAIKLMRSELWRADGIRGRDRLLREAQAMARLSHPNVVTVHEVGAHGDEVFIAMEHVGGRTLRDVARELRHAPKFSWRDIMNLFLQAGRGLAAAHDAGLVHRDFKPENVLVGDDGRVRVTDFGLVSTAGVAFPSADEDLTSSDDLDTPTPIPISTSITITGALLGTPAYMAPEQDKITNVDGRADQFSFCVSLWEALYGERPFGGSTLDEVREAVAKAQLREPPEEARERVPHWIYDTLVRGLSHDPEKRWPSMRELLDRLASDPEATSRQRRRIALVTAVIVGLTATAVVAMIRGPRAGSRVCGGASEEIAPAWNVAMKREVAVRFSETGRSFAGETFERASRLLDMYAQDWMRIRTDACEATHVHHRQSETVLDLRMRCLDRRRASLAAMTQLWTTKVSGEVVDRAIDSIQDLPSLERCNDVDALAAAVPPPDSPWERSRAEDLSKQLDRIEALIGAGRFADAMPDAKDIAARARELGYAPVIARSLYVLGTLQHELGDNKPAEDTLRQAIHAAAQARDDDQAAHAWIALAVVLSEQGRDEDALAQRTATDAFVARAGSGDLLMAEMWTQLGTSAWNLGRYGEAQELHERALAAREKKLGPDHSDVAESLEALGNVLADQGKYEEARARLERAVAIREKALGPRHPSTASARNDLGMLLRDLGKPHEALKYLEPALAVYEETHGSEHADVGRILNNIGLCHSDFNDQEGAEPYLRRALAIKEKALGPTHASTALTLTSLGAVLIELGRPTEARPMIERAFEIQRASLAPDHPNLALPHHTLGAALRLEGKCREAIPHLLEAKAIWEKSLGKDHRQTSYAYFDLGVCDSDLGRPADAIPLLERAIALRASDGRSGSLAEAKWQLGRALWESGKDKEGGLVLIRESRSILTGLRQGRDLEAWLARHKL